MGDSHRVDAAQSEAGGAALADASEADANAVDAAPHHEAQVQAQSTSGGSQSSSAGVPAELVLPSAARAVDGASAEVEAMDVDHASPTAAVTAEGALAPAAATWRATTGAVPAPCRAAIARRSPPQPAAARS